MQYEKHMSIPIVEISQAGRDKILALRETHFCDLKGIAIKPAKLTRTIAALSNAEGGEIYIGVEENKDRATTLGSASMFQKTQMAICRRSSRCFR